MRKWIALLLSLIVLAAVLPAAAENAPAADAAGDTAALVEQGETLLSAGDFEAAVRLFREAAAEWYRKALDAGFEPRDGEEAAHLKELVPEWERPAQ